jgi:predicted NBD/HSP70 family sugar kinase
MEIQEQYISERRRKTRNRIFQLIYHAKTPVSKQQIADSLHLSLPTVHQNIAELLDAGLVRAAEVKRSTGGRPPIGYEVVGDCRIAIGAAITADHLQFILCSLRQEELARRSISHDCDADAQFASFFQRELDKFIRDYCPDTGKLLGVGITIPGIYDEKTDSVVISPTMKLRNFSLNEIVQNEPLPVYIVNDSTGAGAAELASRAPEEKRDFVYLLLENGIGGAIYVNGQVYEGSNGRSAEFGHMRIVPDGRKCNCGQKGCLEAYCSALRFTRDIGLTADEFFDRVAKGEDACVRLFEDVLDHLAMGIINIRMAFDCDIVLGGFVAEYLEPYLGKLREKVASQDPFSGNADYISITKNARAGMRGAAWHFIEQFIEQV